MTDDCRCLCRLETRGDIDSAMTCYREALTFDPCESEARERLDSLTAKLDKQVCGEGRGGEGREGIVRDGAIV